MREPAGTERGPARLRLLVISQYFATREATGQLLVELCSDLADDFDIDVVAAAPPEPMIGGAVLDPRVRVRTVAAGGRDRSTLKRRALNYVDFMARAPAKALGAPRPDVVLCLTDPPFVGLGALLVARLRGAPLVLGAQDVHPQLGQVSGHLSNPLLVAVLRGAQRVLLARGARVIALGDAMRRRLEELGAPHGKVEVIPNWADVSLIRPQARRTGWAVEMGLDDAFVVMHAGNIGQLQNLDQVLEAAPLAPDVTWVIVGDGSGRAALQRHAESDRRANVRLLPWQPRSRMDEVLASADVHLVSLVPGLGGLVEPSKLYGVLASGRPVLAALDRDSEGARIVTEYRCGLTVPPGDARALAAAAETLRTRSVECRDAMGARARRYADERGDRRHAVAAYARVLGEVARSA